MDEKTPGGGTTLADRKNSEGYADPTAYAVLKKLDREEKIRAMDIRRGDMFYINRGGASGNLAGKPAVVVSNDKFNGTSNSVVVVYLTVAPTDDRQTHISVRSGTRPSYAVCESASAVPVEWVGTMIGQCSEREMTNIEIGLLIALDLAAKDVPADEQPVDIEPERDQETANKIAELTAARDIARARMNDAMIMADKMHSELDASHEKCRKLQRQLASISQMYSEACAFAIDETA